MLRREAADGRATQLSAEAPLPAVSWEGSGADIGEDKKDRRLEGSSAHMWSMSKRFDEFSLSFEGRCAPCFVSLSAALIASRTESASALPPKSSVSCMRAAERKRSRSGRTPVPNRERRERQ